MDLDAFAWLLTDEGQAVLARAVEATGRCRAPTSWPSRPSCGVRRPPTASPRRLPRPSCAAGRWRSSAIWRTGCTSPTTASSRPPGSRWPPTGPAGCRPRSPRASSTSGAGSAATWSPSRGRGSPRPGSTSTRVRVAVARANLDALGPGRRGPGGRRDAGRPLAVRRRLRRPGPPQRPRADLPRRGVDAAVVVRRGAAARATRASRSRRASPTPWSRTASRPSGSATAARSRRPRCGRAGWPPTPAGRR